MKWVPAITSQGLTNLWPDFSRHKKAALPSGFGLVCEEAGSATEAIAETSSYTEQVQRAQVEVANGRTSVALVRSL